MPHRHPRWLIWLFPWLGEKPWHGLTLSEYLRGPVLIGTVLVLGVGGIVAGPTWVSDAAQCGQWWPPSSHIFSEDGECVGVSTGSDPFGSQFSQVMKQIGVLDARQPACPGQAAPPTQVNVAAMVTLNSLNTGIRSVHELEGFAAALRESQSAEGDISACPYAIHLFIAQMGADEEAATQDASMLAGMNVQAVVGMGLSSAQSAAAAQILGRDDIPMVADLISAEGFDHDGSASDKPQYSDCASPGPGDSGSASYTSGLGDYFFRVSFRAYQQINAVLPYLASESAGGPLYVVQPASTSDPYTCTALPLFLSGLHRLRPAEDPLTLEFDQGSYGTNQGTAAAEICAQSRPVTVFYTARAVELSTFLDDLRREHDLGTCDIKPITVFSMSDAAQLRVPAPDQSLEEAREAVLGSQAFRQGWLRVLYTPLADPDVLRAEGSIPPGYTDLTTAMRQDGFPVQDLDDGWAIMAYDAVAAVATALAAQSTTPGQIQSALEDNDLKVPGADGTFTFDANGNRSGPGPALVRLCPAASGYQTITVVVRPGKSTSC